MHVPYEMELSGHVPWRGDVESCEGGAKSYMHEFNKSHLLPISPLNEAEFTAKKGALRSKKTSFLIISMAAIFNSMRGDSSLSKEEERGREYGAHIQPPSCVLEEKMRQIELSPSSFIDGKPKLNHHLLHS